VVSLKWQTGPTSACFGVALQGHQSNLAGQVGGQPGRLVGSSHRQLPQHTRMRRGAQPGGARRATAAKAPTGLYWFMPALVNSSVGSLCGTTGLEGQLLQRVVVEVVIAAWSVMVGSFCGTTGLEGQLLQREGGVMVCAGDCAG